MLIEFAFTFALSAAGQGDGPFADLDYDAALEKTKATNQLLLVDFTASWCQPCKRMEKETWGSADVRSWLSEHAIAIQVDVDEEPELAKQFAVEAMPTVVVVRQGEEFDRIVGYRDAAGFLAWGKDVLAGRRTSDELLERAEALKDSDDVEARLDLAEELLHAKQYEKSLEHYLWLWSASRGEPAWRGVRLSFMLGDMADLAKRYEPAKRAFLGILDTLQLELERASIPSLDTWDEWSSMCRDFGERSRVLAWYEKRRDGEGRLFADAADDRAVEPIVADVFEVLMSADRALDAVRLYPDARSYAAKLVSDYERLRGAGAGVDGNSGLDEEMSAHLERSQRQKLAAELSRLFAALLASDRTQEAGDVADLLLATLDSPDSRIALVRAGLEIAKRPDARLTRWLDEAEAAGRNVRILRKRLARLSAGPGDDEGK